MGLRQQLADMVNSENDKLVRNFGRNIHDLDLMDTVEEGIVKKTTGAIDAGVPYAVVMNGIAGGGIDHRLRDIITTYDVETESHDRDQEIENIYAFLKGDAESIKDTKYPYSKDLWAGLKDLKKQGRIR